MRSEAGYGLSLSFNLSALSIEPISFPNGDKKKEWNGNFLKIFRVLIVK